MGRSNWLGFDVVAFRNFWSYLMLCWQAVSSYFLDFHYIIIMEISDSIFEMLSIYVLNLYYIKLWIFLIFKLGLLVSD